MVDAFVDIDSFTSQYIKARKVRIWLPPDYDEQILRHMHDGPNLTLIQRIRLPMALGNPDRAFDRTRKKQKYGLTSSWRYGTVKLIALREIRV